MGYGDSGGKGMPDMWKLMEFYYWKGKGDQGWGGSTSKGKGGTIRSGWSMGGGAGGGKKGGKGAAMKKHMRTKGPAQELPWKLRLSNAYQVTHKKNLTKESIVYTTVETDGTYVCTVTCDDFQGVHDSEQSCETKKEAEESAAKVAVEVEFPDIYGAIDQNAPIAAPSPKVKQPQGEKRKAEPGSVREADGTNAKSRLSNGLMILLERSIEKGEVEYKLQDQGGSCQASVTVTILGDPAETFTGEEIHGSTKDDKKQAEYSAAEAALARFEDAIEAKRPAHEAKKVEKAAEQVLKRAALAAKKAEAAGEAA